MPKYLAEVLHLIDIFKSNKMNVSTIKLLSPRIAPLVPESDPTESRLFSPSFLSFYKDDSLDNIAALPKVWFQYISSTAILQIFDAKLKIENKIKIRYEKFHNF